MRKCDLLDLGPSSIGNMFEGGDLLLALNIPQSERPIITTTGK